MQLLRLGFVVVVTTLTPLAAHASWTTLHDMLNTHCAGCHNRSTIEANTGYNYGSWDTDDPRDVAANSQLILQYVTDHTMPVSSVMTDPERDAFMTELVSWLAVPIPDNIAGADRAVTSYVPTWNAAGTNYGVEKILRKRCTGSCHRGNFDWTFDSVEIPAAITFPNWIDFTNCKTTLMTSYFSPGYSKIEASIVRVENGSMPPGVPPDLALSPIEKELLRCWVMGGAECRPEWIANRPLPSALCPL